jgi:class 3 adenylate cyclase
VPKDVHPRLASLARRCWHEDPLRRPTAQEVVDELGDIWTEMPEDVSLGSSKGSLECAQAVFGVEPLREAQRAVLSGAEAPPLVAPSVSLIFTDIVDFTAKSQEMSPAEVASMLNGLFAKFEVLTAEHGGVVYKTIGDAYIVAVVGAGHEARAVDLGLGMATSAAGTPFVSGEDGARLGNVAIRVGIHCGAVASQMISATAVELVGDTVNFASRLESTGEARAVHVSEAIAEAVRSKRAHHFVPRPKMAIKGKGNVQTFFVTAR